MPLVSGGSFARSITVYVDSRIDTLDPHHTTSFAGHLVASTLHQGLFHYQNDGRLVPALVKDWTVSDNGLEYHFTLKSDLQWSDGSPLEAKDIVAGIKRSLNPLRPSPFAGKLYPIKNAEAYLAGALSEGESLGLSALDAQTVQVSLHRRDNTFLDVLAHPVAKPAPARNPDLITGGRVTSGTYGFEVRENNYFKLTSNSEGPNLTFKVSNSVEQIWRASQRDEAFITASMPIVSVPRVGDRGDIVRIDNGESLYAYAVNMEKVAFDTLEVRHALSMSVDRTELLKNLPITSAMPATQFVSPSARTYAKSYTTPFSSLTFEEREAVAEALLAELGLGPNANFVVRLRIPEGAIHKAVADSISRMWSTVGVSTETIQSPFPLHWQAVEEGDFDIAFVSWPTARDNPLGVLEPLSQSAGPWNFANYSFPEFDERLARAAESTNADVRADYHREAEKALIEDQSIIALFYYQPLALVSPNISGWQSTSAGIHPLTDLSIVSEEFEPHLSFPSIPKEAPSNNDEP